MCERGAGRGWAANCWKVRGVKIPGFIAQMHHSPELSTEPTHLTAENVGFLVSKGSITHLTGRDDY